VRGWLASVDLSDPRLRFVVTEPLAASADAPAGAEARLMPTDRWAESLGLDLAINASFFARLSGDGGLPLPWTEGMPVDILGLSLSDGRIVSPPRKAEGGSQGGDPALLIDETGGAGRERRCPCLVRVAFAEPARFAGVEDAVAGMGPRRGEPGTLLVEAGSDRGVTAQVAPMARHPRTAAAVTKGGATLLLAVVDGRQKDWSVGVTLPELARILIEAGAWDALNLDGGGSSTMWAKRQGEAAGAILNRPSDGRVRPVANHLGVRVVR
jgi:exopolysaccharide biosynthesis protein